MQFGNRKKYFRGSFQSELSPFNENHPSQNLKFNNLGIFQSLKSRISMEIIHRISTKLNFTQNTLGCYGLNQGGGKSIFQFFAEFFQKFFHYI